MSQTHQILWIDDEIEALQPHTLVLRDRGYAVTPVTNGEDGIALLTQSETQYSAIPVSYTHLTLPTKA